MRSIREVLSEITQTFSLRQIANPRRQAEDLLCDLLHFTRLQLYTQFDLPLEQKEWQICQSWVERRLQGEPLAYICGKVNFYGCFLEITPAVLIPRQETELLVDKVAKYLKQQEIKGKVLWDICCGSGCVGIALKKTFPDLSVFLTDSSAQAVELSQHNAALNDVQVMCLQGDLLKPFQGCKADFVVCNPPYISENEYATLDREVGKYEPREALIAGPTGLEIYARLAKELPPHLNPKARVWLEIGFDQGSAVQKVFDTPVWNKCWFENDWAGHNRFFFLENE